VQHIPCAIRHYQHQPLMGAVHASGYAVGRDFAYPVCKEGKYRLWLTHTRFSSIIRLYRKGLEGQSTLGTGMIERMRLGCKRISCGPKERQPGAGLYKADPYGGVNVE